MAIFIGGILTRLIANSRKATEPYGKNSNPSIEIIERSLQFKTNSDARARLRETI